jgi:chorismate mutase
MGESRTGTRELELLRNRLSQRDHDILQSVRDHRFLTTKQIARFHFNDHETMLAGTRACVRVLARLRDHRLLRRLNRQVGGVRAGSTSFIWCLDAVGERLTRTAPTDQGSAVRARPFEPSVLYLAHTLAIAEAHLTWREVARQGGFELIEVSTEPRNWRRYVGLGGGVHILKPDLYVVTHAAEWEDHWFVEIDLNTESIPVLIAKCHQYERYRRTGLEQAKLGVFPAVLWVLSSHPRRARLAAAVGADEGLDVRLFRFIESQQLATALMVAPETELSRPPVELVSPDSGSEPLLAKTECCINYLANSST